MALLSLLILILINNVFLGGLLYQLLFNQFGKTLKNSYKPFLFLLSLGFSPFVPSLILYYAFILIPHKPMHLYILLVFLVYVALYLLARQTLPEIFTDIKNSVIEMYGRLVTVLLLGFILVFSIAWVYAVSTTPIIRHDVFEYGALAKLYFNNRVITYEKHIYDPVTNFYFVGKHGFLFPLLNTWERMCNSIFGINSDFYFRSISGYYYLLTILGVFTTLYKKDPLLAFFVSLNIILTTAFSSNVMYYHLDTARIFMIGMGTFLVYRYLTDSNQYFKYLAAAYLGLGSNVHSTVLVFSVVLLPLSILVKKDSLKNKVYDALTMCAIFLFFGGLHYLLDIFLGRGWTLL